MTFIETVGAMDPGRYELATVAAARVLRSSYCSLAHGQVLAEQFLGPDKTRALAEGDAGTALDPDLHASLTVGRPIAEA
jgi:hypothetical protein